MNNLQNLPTLTILGTGYVGVSTAAIFAAAGMRVYVVDPNDERLAAIRAGRSFFYEAGIDPLIAQAVEQERIIPTGSYAEAVPESDIVISAVGTPDKEDGSSNLAYVFAAAEEAAKYLKPGAIYVQKSTVPVGTGAQVTQALSDAGAKVAYVSNPEFLREGTSVEDTLWFDRVVVGGDDADAVEHVMDVYRQVERVRDSIATTAGVMPKSPQAGRYIATSLQSAELIKVTANAFLALKISFANSIAKLADAAGADVVEVMDAVGADKRIGRAFLNAGRGYGGGCFPKDVSGLIAVGKAYRTDMGIMEAAQAVNNSMPAYIITRLKDVLHGSYDGKCIAVLGLSFKAGTSDTRRSPGIAIANTLVKNGAHVQVFDPQANKEAAHSLEAVVTICDDIETALHDAEAVIVTTEWSEFTRYAPEDFAKGLAGTIFVDAINGFDPRSIRKAKLLYLGVGRA